ncbi:MAG: YdeI/OmpD-associated family protein [Chitinophagaceae bacterium]
MKASGPKELNILSFKTPKEFEKWLSKNHNISNGIWLRFFKKDSGEKTITYSEALDEALCYGWIDGQADKYDDKSWIQRFTPRRAKSIWSKRNTNHIERLTALGKMKPSGLCEVEKAKADGRWEKSYDSQSTTTIPDDFMKELSKNKKAKAFFESLNKANKYAIAWRLQTAKKLETREKRMKAILEMLSKGEKFH